jgi:hypothetical protein
MDLDATVLTAAPVPGGHGVEIRIRTDQPPPNLARRILTYPETASAGSMTNAHVVPLGRPIVDVTAARTTRRNGIFHVRLRLLRGRHAIDRGPTIRKVLPGSAAHKIHHLMNPPRAKDEERAIQRA